MAFSNFKCSKELLVLTPKLLNNRLEIAPVLRVALSSKLRKVVFTTSCR